MHAGGVETGKQERTGRGGHLTQGNVSKDNAKAGNDSDNLQVRGEISLVPN